MLGRSWERDGHLQFAAITLTCHVGGTSADDFDRFLIVAVVNWCLWRNFYHGKLKTPDIGFKVTRPIDALVGLYCQRREDAVLTLQILLNGG